MFSIICFKDDIINHIKDVDSLLVAWLTHHFPRSDCSNYQPLLYFSGTKLKTVNQGGQAYTANKSYH